MSRLVVFAGALLERSESGRWVTKQAFADYLQGLAQRFEKVTFVARVDKAKTGYLGDLGDAGIEVVALGSGRVSMLKNYFRVLESATGAYLIVFFPNGTALWPIWGRLKRVSRRIAVYFGNDYHEWLGKLRISKVPGGEAVYRRANLVAIKSADVVFARGRAIAEQCGELNSNVVETVPIGYLNPIESNLYDDGLDWDKQPIRLLFVGALSERKGIPVLFDAMALLMKQGCKDLTLDVLGDGPSSGDLRDLAQAKLGEGVVNFRGWVEGDATEIYWSRADLLVVPSLYAEGVPRVIDEAIMRKVPVVSSRVGGIGKEFNLGEIRLIEPDDSEALASAMLEILTSPEARKTLLTCAEFRREKWLNTGSVSQQHADQLLEALS